MQYTFTKVLETHSTSVKSILRSSSVQSEPISLQVFTVFIFHRKHQIQTGHHHLLWEENGKALLLALLLLTPEAFQLVDNYIYCKIYYVVLTHVS